MAGPAEATGEEWGGFLLTLTLASVGIVLALPIGILLALGRRSQLPVIRAVSVVFIEFWRGTPLITILFMASVMLPLFFPSDIDFNKVVRAMVGITLFQSAYTAEAVRGGLQAIPRGQYEAADALGLGYWKTMIFIILPQSLRISIPGIVNTFIALFKDTSLVSIIGLLDLLNMAQTASRSPEWKGLRLRGLHLRRVPILPVYVMACRGILSTLSASWTAKLNTRSRSHGTFAKHSGPNRSGAGAPA